LKLLEAGSQQLTSIKVEAKNEALTFTY
jgi:hypothetical protein